jgi:hypothetical protein
MTMTMVKIRFYCDQLTIKQSIKHTYIHMHIHIAHCILICLFRFSLSPFPLPFLSLSSLSLSLSIVSFFRFLFLCSPILFRHAFNFLLILLLSSLAFQLVSLAWSRLLAVFRAVAVIWMKYFFFQCQIIIR